MDRQPFYLVFEDSLLDFNRHIVAAFELFHDLVGNSDAISLVNYGVWNSGYMWQEDKPMPNYNVNWFIEHAKQAARYKPEPHLDVDTLFDSVFGYAAGMNQLCVNLQYSEYTTNNRYGYAWGRHMFKPAYMIFLTRTPLSTNHYGVQAPYACRSAGQGMILSLAKIEKALCDNDTETIITFILYHLFRFSRIPNPLRTFRVSHGLVKDFPLQSLVCTNCLMRANNYTYEGWLEDTRFRIENGALCEYCLADLKISYSQCHPNSFFRTYMQTQNDIWQQEEVNCGNNFCYS